MLARFLPLLHKAMSEGLAEAVDDIQTAGALQLGDGWMHIHGKLRLGDSSQLMLTPSSHDHEHR
jgi:hypothetical protein